MNKISKKIVALVTMAAFVLTLVPVAAFATNATTEAALSSVQTAKKNVSVEAGDPVKIDLDIRNANDEQILTGDAGDVLVWAEDEAGNVTRLVNFTKTAGGTFHSDRYKTTVDYGKALNLSGNGVLNSIGSALNVTFTQPGTYTIKAGVVYADLTSVPNIERSDITKFADVADYNTVTVTAVDAGDVDGVTISAANKDSEKIFTAATAIKPNNTATQTHTVKATIDGKAAKNETFKITTSSSNITVTAKDMNDEAFEAGTAVTDKNGEFKISYSVAKAGNYKVYLTSEDGYKVTLNVATTDMDNYAADIEATTENVTLNKDDVNSGSILLSDAVQYTITDKNSNVVTTDQTTGQGLLAKEPAVTGGNADYVKLIAKPDKFTGSYADFKLAWDAKESVYTLQYTGTKLVPGEYTVRIALQETGAYADATFSVGEFDDNAVVDMKVVPSSDRVAYTEGDFTYKVILVDENGVEKNVTGVPDEYYMGITSSATLDAEFASVDSTSGVKFNVVDEKDKEDVIGSVITLTTVSDKYGFIKKTEVTITDESVAAGIAFDNDNGKAGEENTVKVSVVDADGNIVKDASGVVKVYVADQSNENANIEVNPGASVSEGKNGSLTIYSDKETTLEIVVAVVNTSTNKVYADTLTYTVGEADVNADKIVAMTIGSTDMIVDNEIVAGDAAPYVADSRTMVPIRVLSETFGAEVDFKDNVVTIVDGDTTIVMTIGETTYTINDEEQTMDVAPVIGSGDRTYVPIRFVAEALGYKVTPLYAADGTTASVVFQK